MKAHKIVAAATLAILAAAGAQAETYQGVHPLVSANSRAAVSAEATAAARAGNTYSDGAMAQVAPALTNPADRSAVRAQAVAAAHGSAQNLYREAFVNSTIPSQYKIARPTTQQAGL